MSEGSSSAGSSRVVDVLMPVAVDRAYSYRLPPGLDATRGQFVEAPLGTRMTTGVVWSVGEGDGANLKTIARLRDIAPLAPALLDFIEWVARWTLAPRGMVLRMAARAPETATAPQPRLLIRATGKPPSKLTPAREKVLAALAAQSLTKTSLAEAAGCSTGVIDALVEDGALETIAAPQEPIVGAPNPDHIQARLSPAQSAAADALIDAVAKRAFSATLLEGVTG